MSNIIHTDCFAYQNNTRQGCSILKELYCKEGKCKFYKKDRNEIQKKITDETED